MAVDIPDQVHAELQNWARWCWAGALPHPLPATHCGSLEAGYRPPPQWGEDDTRRAPVIRANDRNARIVQAAWELLPLGEKQVLREEYPASLKARAVQGRDAAARRLGITLGWYEAWLQGAVNKVEAAFDEVRA